MGYSFLPVSGIFVQLAKNLIFSLPKDHPIFFRGKNTLDHHRGALGKMKIKGYFLLSLLKNTSLSFFFQRPFHFGTAIPWTLMKWPLEKRRKKPLFFSFFAQRSPHYLLYFAGKYLGPSWNKVIKRMLF